jgi:hypothetical protein
MAVPDGLKTKTPERPVEVVQLKFARGVPLKLMVEDDPGQSEVDVVKLAVGA